MIIFGSAQPMGGRRMGRAVPGGTRICASAAHSGVEIFSHRSYAVRIQTDRLRSITAYFACGSMVRFCLIPEHVARRATCSGIRLFHSTLPEANRASCPGRRLVWNRPRNSCYLTRLTRLLTRKEISPPAERKIPFFFTKILHFVQNFCEKDQNVPCCRRRFCRSPGETPGLMNHRVTPVISGQVTGPAPSGRLHKKRE